MKSVAVLVEYDPQTKSYGATSPDLPDVFAVSDSRDDVLERFTYSANEYIQYLREKEQPLPTFSIRLEVVNVSLPAG